MRIQAGEFEIIDSGTVISFNNEPLTFHLAADLRIRLSFRDDTDNKEHRMEFLQQSNKELEIVMINFNNSLGIGNTAPLALATLNNRRVYLNYRVYTLSGNSNRTIHFTWYLREEVKNG
jgi:hypothetical protein